ncbi:MULTISPECIES: lipoprotein [Cupriavidus]|jgi:Prokaryotic membrane lipoprotein lipid attachment site|uniref:lipoprotein n=1 Tax=Cupriavidus TaxID=106589 RepID=UPI0005609A24|nr:lipoprotein [Cupriavidus metallidurans]KWW32371.1 hypothetical protein AU374_05971 [Cupriavidus metallidurans]
MRKYIVFAMLALALAGCNGEKGGSEVVAPSGLNGTYTSVDGKNTWVFSSDGTVKTKSLRGEELVTSYVNEKGKVTFTFPHGYPISVSVNSDGTLTSDSNMSYKKVE